MSNVKEPRLELEYSDQGDKWCVEYHHGRHDITVQVAQIKQPVFIYKCEDCTLEIEGKAKRIVVDGCNNVTLNFKSVLSGLEVYNSQKIRATVNGTLPTATVIKTNRFQLDLSAESQQCEVYASCSSDINMSYPKEGGGVAHFHVPEQTRTVWNGEKFITSIDKNS